MIKIYSDAPDIVLLRLREDERRWIGFGEKSLERLTCLIWRIARGVRTTPFPIVTTALTLPFIGIAAREGTSGGLFIVKSTKCNDGMGWKCRYDRIMIQRRTIWQSFDLWRHDLMSCQSVSITEWVLYLRYKMTFRNYCEHDLWGFVTKMQ